MYEEISSNDDGKPFDYIIRGEGEKTFGDMLDAIEGKQKWEDIPGLSYRYNGGFLHNPPRSLENLEILQLPAERRPVYVNLYCYQPGDCGTYACNTS